MKTKILFICLFLFFLPIVAFAQENEFSVKLKNGIELVGAVTHNDDGTVTVVTKENDTFVFLKEEIDNIEIPKEVLEARRQAEIQAKKLEEEMAIAEKRNDRKAKRNERQTKGKGYMPILETGFGITKCYVDGIFEYQGMKFSDRIDYTALQSPLLHWINGISFSPHFYLGLGGGVNLNFGDIYHSQCPFYLHLRTTMSKGTVAPYLALSGGGAIGFDDFDVHPYGEATLGIRIGKMKKRGTWIGVGVYYTGIDTWRGVKIGEDYFYEPFDYLQNYNLSVSLKLAFSF